MPPLSTFERDALSAMYYSRFLTKAQARALNALIPDEQVAWWECTVEISVLDWGDSEAAPTTDWYQEEIRQLQVRAYVDGRLAALKAGTGNGGKSREGLLIALFGVPAEPPTRWN